MFCNECGTKNSADSKYCKECGAKINMVYRTMMLSVQDLNAVVDTEGQERLTRLLDMAFWHNEAGHVDAALRACHAALEINPSSTTAHSLLGTLYEKKGDDARAIEHFESVLTLNPDSGADAAKLEQLRSGIHAGPVRQPAAYRWVPPALAGIKLPSLPASLTQAPWREKVLSVRSKPALAAGVAAAAVMALGLLLVRPAPQRAQAATPRLASTASTLPVAVNRSAFSGAAAAANDPMASLKAPIVLSPSLTRPAPPLVIVHDPFAETLPGASPHVRAVPFLTYPAVRPSGAARARLARGARHGALPALPPLKPLSLTAVPLSGGVAPAPVSVPLSASVADVPEHTVVVTHLNTMPVAPMIAAAVTSGGGSPAQGSIHITVENSRSDDADAGSSRRVSGNDTPSGQAEAYQQSALAMQQQGDYTSARQHYQKAIRAYKAQIAVGRDAETAQRGIEVCQTGLQICQQSQP